MADVLTTDEAYRQFGRSAVLANLGRGLWQRPARGVILTHNGPIDPMTREYVVLAASQAGAALGGLTALAHEGFVGFTSRVTQLVLPGGARAPSLAGVESHWSEFLDERDVHPSRAPRRTRVARSVIAAVQQRLTSVRHVREALTRRGKCRHRALIVESVLDAFGGIQSLPERDMRSIIAGLGWRVEHQQAVRGRDGRYFLDLYVPELDLSIEVHGIPHLAVQRWDQDLLRANEIVIAGARLLIFSSYAIRHERAAVVDQLRRFAAHHVAA
jgi:very-short-patch-repair endonuclease